MNYKLALISILALILSASACSKNSNTASKSKSEFSRSLSAEGLKNMYYNLTPDFIDSNIALLKRPVEAWVASTSVYARRYYILSKILYSKKFGKWKNALLYCQLIQCKLPLRSAGMVYFPEGFAAPTFRQRNFYSNLCIRIQNSISEDHAGLSNKISDILVLHDTAEIKKLLPKNFKPTKFKVPPLPIGKFGDIPEPAGGSYKPK